MEESHPAHAHNPPSGVAFTARAGFLAVMALSLPLILASASPRRRELLASLGVPFEVVTAAVTEHEDATTDPRAMVTHNAALKADWVAARWPDALVLGADTTVFLDGAAINKPRDLADARTMLRRLSGLTHKVFTGLALRRGADRLALDDVATSDVTFRVLDDAAIDAYFALVNPLDKAGAYGVQEHGEMVVAHHTGSFSNIMGLPLENLRPLLARFGALPV
jgi:septum formation protein